MKKIISLIKASMTQNMSLFRIKTKKQNSLSNLLIPIILIIALSSSIVSYTIMIIEPLREVHMEFVVLTLFAFLTSIMTITEGIYKSSDLLFKCKDDNILFSLPISKTVILIVRVFKLYLFELLFNSILLLPAIFVYAYYVKAGIMYYIVSFIALLILPIIPIVLSCIIGGIISLSSSKFRFKNIAQIAITTIFLLFLFYGYFNLEKLIKKLAENATSINDLITKLYYPVGAYIKLITEFNLLDLIRFVLINIIIFIGSIVLLSRIYFKLNSNVKSVKTIHKSKKYKIKCNKPIVALIKKELNRFINSPVFVINAGFGLVTFVAGCLVISLKTEKVIEIITMQFAEITPAQFELYLPVILFGLICMASLLSSITSSMISLEGKSFNILKSLPINPATVIAAKVLTAVLIMIPFFLLGDLIVFIRFKFTLLQIIVLLISSVVVPLVAEIFGIVINLKYPKMDAQNDTQVVKQSMSSMVAVCSGLVLTVLTGYILFKCVYNNFLVDKIIICGICFYTIILFSLLVYLKKIGIKDFDSINA